MNKQTVRDIDVSGKRVLVRVDYNVPMKNGEVSDPFRIEASFETLKYVLDHGGSLALLSHLGEPKGAPDPQLSLKPVAAKAAELLGTPIAFYDDCVGDEFMAAATALKPGEIIMGENVRFYAEELADDPKFAEKLSKLGEIYVNDSFAVDHRAQASVSGIPAYLPGVAGFLVEKEVNYIQGALEHPNRPLVAVLGGAKVSTKIPILKNIIPKVDVLMVTGPVANTFALAQGMSIGKSVAEPDMVDTVKDLLKLMTTENTELLLPEDVVVSESVTEPKKVRTVKLSSVGDNDYIVDAAPSYGVALTEAVHGFFDFDNKSTVIWNGPLGITEIPEFAAGTKAMAEAILALPSVVSIVGGGDTAAFVDHAGLHDKFTWVSTGGGASLELMSGNELPGIAALRDKALE